jgi:hypothetical protein
MPFDITDGISQFKPYLIVVKNLNMKVAGAVALGPPLPGNKIFVPFWGGVAIQQISGAGSAPTISIGTNATAYDNIAAATALTGLLQARVAPIQFKTQYPFLTNGVQTFLNVSVAATTTTYLLTVAILGFTV